MARAEHDRILAASVWSVSAPAKVILFGEHAVLYGHPAIAVAIGLHCKFRITIDECFKDGLQIDIVFHNLSGVKSSFINPTEPGDLTLSPEKTLEKAWDLASANASTNHEVVRSTCVCAYLLLRAVQLTHTSVDKRIFGPRLSAHIDVHAEIPVGSGLGSSGAFSAAAATTFLLLTGYFSDSSVDTLTCNQKSVIKSLAHEAECIIHGQASGIDTAISVQGGGIYYQRSGANVTLRELPDFSAVLPGLLIINSGVNRCTTKAVEHVANQCRRDPQAVDIIESIGRVVLDAFEVLTSEKGSSQLPTLIKQNQELLRRLGLSHTVVDAIVSLASQMDLEAKLTGAGLGGCVLAFPRNAESAVQKLEAAAELIGRQFWCQVVRTSVNGVVLHRA